MYKKITKEPVTDGLLGGDDYKRADQDYIKDKLSNADIEYEEADDSAGEDDYSTAAPTAGNKDVWSPLEEEDEEGEGGDEGEEPETPKTPPDLSRRSSRLTSRNTTGCLTAGEGEEAEVEGAEGEGAKTEREFSPFVIFKLPL